MSVKISKASKPAKKAKKSKKTKTPGKRAPRQGMSAINAAHKLLVSADKPMHVKDMIERAEKKGYWKSPEGKTPVATLAAAIRREIQAKGKKSRFAYVAPGIFEASGYEPTGDDRPKNVKKPTKKDKRVEKREKATKNEKPHKAKTKPTKKKAKKVKAETISADEADDGITLADDQEMVTAGEAVEDAVL